MFDVIIIGDGPAGLSAAINLKRRNKNVLVFGNKKSLLYKADSVDNYLGMKNVTGTQMMESFVNHAQSLEIEIKHDFVTQALSMGDYYVLNANNNFFEARAVIICVGVSSGKKIAGEQKLLGKGVSYCATCDGMLYKNKNVVVIGDSMEAEEDVKFLAELCAKVSYVPKYSFEKKSWGNVEIIKDLPVEVLGENFVTGVKFKESYLDCDGVFFIKDKVSANDIFPQIQLNDKNMICVNRFMETNLPGVFAAGDCTGWPFQVSKAVGEGLVAALQAVKFLDNKF